MVIWHVLHYFTSGYVQVLLTPRTFSQFMYISTTLYTPAAFCTKVTLLLLIARVFSVHPVISKLIHILIILIFLVELPIEFLKIFVCEPVTAYWENLEKTEGGALTGANSSCRGQAKLFMGDISISIATDVIILILPMVMAWRMEAPWRQKLKIIILIGAGGAATVTTIVRACLSVQSLHATSTSVWKTHGCGQWSTSSAFSRLITIFLDVYTDFALSSIAG